MQKVNLNDIAGNVAQELNVSKKDAVAIANALVNGITEQLVAGNQVSVTGFGSFVSKERAARQGRNPQNGEVITIEARKVVSFKPSSKLKEAVR